MSTQMTNPQGTLQGVAKGDISAMDALQRFIESSFTESGLDPQTFMLVRIAALATLDAAPASWLMNLNVGVEAGLTPEQILGTLIAITPVIGSARLVSAAGNIIRA